MKGYHQMKMNKKNKQSKKNWQSKENKDKEKVTQVKPSLKNKKRVPTIKVGTHKKLTAFLWLLLVGSLSFGVYKNFTAIDRHTVHEKEIVEQRVIDTNSIERFVESFAKEFYSWQQSPESINSRNERLKEYFTEDLQQLNAEMIRSDIPTSSTVNQVQVWNVTQLNNSKYAVLFSVGQQLTENEKKNQITSTYNVTVYVDKNGAMVIVKNPTMDSQPKKSGYQPKQAESDGTVDTATSEEISSFLETFFKLYPTATEEELAYYVSDNALPVVKREYVFAELLNPIYGKKDNRYTVSVTVEYLDQETKATQLSQYALNLEKQDNWKIVK